MPRRSNRSLLCASLVGALAVLAAGCGTARYVQRTQTGGTLALEGDRNKAMEEASKMMVAHCQGAYTIISEGETVVGSDTSHQDQSYVTKDGRVVNQGGESTRTATEWRVNYQCGQAAPPPPPPGYAPPPPGAPAYPDPNAPPPSR
jgi:hypothetical protein